MIYFDNAATTLTKPPEVVSAVVSALGTFGGVGRGVHKASLQAGMAVFEARQKVARLFNAPAAGSVVFAANATMALNMAVYGLLDEGDHAVTTAASHNSVLRPLYQARKHGCSLSVLPVLPDASIDIEAFDALFTPQTKLAVVTHASNVTGDIYDIERLAAVCHSHGALCVVDAAQTGGVIPFDMEACGADVVVFTGHKGLLGPQGTGGMCIAEGIALKPMVAGGTGTHSFDEDQPRFLPEGLEAGTLNGHGIAGLSAGIGYLERVGIDAVAQRIRQLTERFEAGVRRLEGVRVYGGRAPKARCAIVALNVGGFDAAVISDILNTDYGVCTRPGAHCAPLMHEALGTAEQGIVRFSFSHSNTEAEIDGGIAALAEIVEASRKPAWNRG